MGNSNSPDTVTAIKNQALQEARAQQLMTQLVATTLMVIDHDILSKYQGIRALPMRGAKDGADAMLMDALCTIGASACHMALVAPQDRQQTTPQAQAIAANALIGKLAARLQAVADGTDKPVSLVVAGRMAGASSARIVDVQS